MTNVLRKADTPWIDAVAGGPEYLEPAYYDRILRPYVFSRRTDLNLFHAFLTESTLPRNATILEIGPGTGRATRVLGRQVGLAQIDFVDQSQRMLNHLQSHLSSDAGQRFIRSDAVSYLLNSSSTYEFVFSLWSLSHSIHQNIGRKGEPFGRTLALYALRKLFGTALRRSGRFFFIHFDSTSEEQRISLRQRSRIETWLAPGIPSPSQLVIESALAECAAQGLIRFRKRHLKGSAIIYSSLDEALEVFMNFHMEGAFNRRAEFKDVVTEVAQDLSKYRRPDGRIAVKPGCFIYSGVRL